MPVAVSIRPSDMSKQVRCGVTVHVRKKSNPSEIGVYNAPCKMWRCSDCRPMLEERWFTWLSYKITALETVYIQFVSDSSWGSVHKRIVRAGGEYASIRQIDGLCVVFTNVPEGKGEPVGVASATDMLRRFISSAYPARPIHTSKGWAIQSNPVKNSDWERIQELPISVSEAAEQLTMLGIEVSWYFGYVIHGFSATLPDNIDLFIVNGKLRLVPCIVPRTLAGG